MARSWRRGRALASYSIRPRFAAGLNFRVCRNQGSLQVEKKQADAIVQAILEPDLRGREELRRKREAEARGLRISRFVAAFVLVGFAIGALIAYSTGERFTNGGLWGSAFGAVVGRTVAAWRDRRRTA